MLGRARGGGPVGPRAIGGGCRGGEPRALLKYPCFEPILNGDGAAASLDRSTTVCTDRGLGRGDIGMMTRKKPHVKGAVFSHILYHRPSRYGLFIVHIAVFPKLCPAFQQVFAQLTDSLFT